MIRGSVAFRIVLRPVTSDDEPIILYQGEATTAELGSLPAIDRSKIRHLMQEGVVYVADIECHTFAGWEHFMPMEIALPAGYHPWPRAYQFGAEHFTSEHVTLVRDPADPSITPEHIALVPA